MQKEIRDNIYMENKKQKQFEFSNCKGNINKIWRTAKNMFFKEKGSFPEKIVINDNLIEGSKNEYFKSKVKWLINKIPSSNGDPIKHYIKKN